MANNPSINPLKHRQAQSKSKRMMPAITPITMPAMAPPLSPPLEVDVEPVMMLPPVPTGVTKGCVVVALPTWEVTVTKVLLVGRRGALAVFVTTVVTV